MAEAKSKGKTLSALGFSLPKVEKTAVPNDTAERFLAAVPEQSASPRETATGAGREGKGRGGRKKATAARKVGEVSDGNPKERLTVYLPLDLTKRLDRMGVEERYSRSALIERAVNELVSTWERGES